MMFKPLMGTPQEPKDLIAYAEGLESLVVGANRRADDWRFIANEMGYEPNAHQHPPLSAWHQERIAKFRARVVAEAVAALPKEGEEAIDARKLLELTGEVVRAATDLCDETDQTGTTSPSSGETIVYAVPIEGSNRLNAALDALAEALPDREQRVPALAIDLVIDALSSLPVRSGEVAGALADVAAERRRQIEAEGWTLGHDDRHDDGDLADAAACYAVSRQIVVVEEFQNVSTTRELWPWDAEWWKPKGRRQDLVRAGALIVAEIERLDRAALAPPPQAQPLCEHGRTDRMSLCNQCEGRSIDGSAPQAQDKGVER